MKTSRNLLAATAAFGLLAGTSTASADLIGYFGGPGTFDFNTNIWYNNTTGTGSVLPTNGTAPNEISALAAGRFFTLDSNVNFGGAVNAKLNLGAGNSLTVNAGSNIDLALIEADNFNGAAVQLTINGGTFDMDRFVNGASKTAGLAINGGTFTANSVTNDASQMTGGIDFNLASANITFNAGLNISSAPSVNFSVAPSFTSISAGASYVTLDQANTNVTLLSNPGYVGGEVLTLVSSSNGGNFIANNGSPKAFAGGFGGTYQLSNSGGNIIATVITGTTAVPEPAAFGIVAVLGLALVAYRRRRVQQVA